MLRWLRCLDLRGVDLLMLKAARELQRERDVGPRSREVVFLERQSRSGALFFDLESFDKCRTTVAIERGAVRTGISLLLARSVVFEVGWINDGWRLLFGAPTARARSRLAGFGGAGTGMAG